MCSGFDLARLIDYAIRVCNDESEIDLFLEYNRAKSFRFY